MSAKPVPISDALPADDGLSLREVSIADLETVTPPARKFFIEGILPERAVTLLGAHGGTGKSALALTLAAHLAMGAPWHGLNTQQCRVVFLSLEDDGDEVRRRLKNLCAAYRLRPAEIAPRLRVLDGSDAGALVFEETTNGDRHLVNTAAMEDLKSHAAWAQVLIVDNASDALDGNENERRIVRAFVRRLAALVKQQGGAVLLLAHVNRDSATRGGKESYSGSTAWHNSARSRLAMVPVEDTGVRVVHEKCNVGPKVADRQLRWTEHGVLIPDTSIRETEGATPGATDDGMVLDALREAERRGVRVPTAASGARTAFSVLAGLLPRGLASKGDRVRAALNRLELNGAIERATHKGKDRVPREHWATSSAGSAGNAGNPGNAGNG